MSQQRVIHLPVQPMTAEAFAPYGETFGVTPSSATRRILPTGFSHEGRVTLSVIDQPSAESGFSRLERHFGVTQGFVQLGGAQAVVCVAPATNLSDLAAVPDPDQVRAFRIDPTLGYLFHLGTWHSLDRYLTGSGGASFLIVNVDPNPTQIVDYATGRSQVYDDLDVSKARDLTPMTHTGISFEI